MVKSRQSHTSFATFGVAWLDERPFRDTLWRDTTKNHFSKPATRHDESIFVQENSVMVSPYQKVDQVGSEHAMGGRIDRSYPIVLT